MSLRLCGHCGEPLAETDNGNRKYHLHCITPYRRAYWNARYANMTEEQRATHRARVERNRLKTMDATRQRQRKWYFKDKILRIAAEEAKEKNLSLEAILQQWGAI